LARKADDLPRFLRERKSIIVTTQQKFAWVLEQIENNPALKKLRVAFLIDEAHRSQEGQMGAPSACCRSDRKADEQTTDDAGNEERKTKTKRRTEAESRSPGSSASTT
jgi:type I restriction enzyme R subunit